MKTIIAICIFGLVCGYSPRSDAQVSRESLHAKVISIGPGQSIQGETFFTVRADNRYFRGTKDFELDGTRIMNYWPNNLSGSILISNNRFYSVLGMFSEQDTDLVWTVDQRSGRPLLLLRGFIGGFNQVYFDNATSDMIQISVDGELLPILNAGQHGRGIWLPGEYLVTVSVVENGEKTEVESTVIVVENRRVADEYIYNVGQANSYRVLEKTFELNSN